MAQRSGCLAPYHCGPCPGSVDPEAVYYDLCPNQIGGPCSKVWYKMKNGYIYQYTYSFNDDDDLRCNSVDLSDPNRVVNFVRAQGYQNRKNGCVMSDLMEIAKREGTK